MDLLLKPAIVNPQSAVRISGSKSETNRLLVLRALYPQLGLQNLSPSDDSKVMMEAFEATGNTEIDIRHAGTAMRFLSAYFAIQPGKTTVLTGSARMKERPILVLVDALRQLGAAIAYQQTEGFPPLKISGKKLSGGKITLKADVSSQYISALLLIAPQLENGLELILEGKVTSRPYIEMTLGLLRKIGIEGHFENNTISIKPASGALQPSTIVIESDWSSASYFYSIVALSETGTSVTLSTFKPNSLQGDSILADIYKDLGVATTFGGSGSLTLTKTGNRKPAALNLDLNNAPDLAQTIAVSCFALGIGCHLSGLHTLKIKETDRLQALKNELSKLGGQVSITDQGITVGAATSLNAAVKISTYQDHRMAMAFAPLALKVPIIIEDAEVVSKSYPAFWNDLKTVGFVMEEV